MENDRRQVVDISQTVDESTAAWPGDQSFRRSRTAKLGQEGSNVNLGAFEMSAHLGTHADAPFHFDEAGACSEAFSLQAFCGPAQVVAVEEDAIAPSHVRGLNLEATPRVLFKTVASQAPSTEWNAAFPPILPQTMRQLGEGGAVLVGTDAPSVDPVDSAALPAHHAMARHGMYNLENLALAGVTPGRYELWALPMKLNGMDAAPVRAVLQQKIPQQR